MLKRNGEPYKRCTKTKQVQLKFHLIKCKVRDKRSAKKKEIDSSQSKIYR